MNKRKFAEEWIAAWNHHDLDAMMAFYSEDVEFISPSVKVTLGNDDGRLQGKGALRDFWQAELGKFNDLHFELLDVTHGLDSLAIYYQSIMDTKAMDVLFFNQDGKIHKVIEHYT